MDFNYFQSLKWQKKEDLLNEELKKYKVDELRPIYKLSIYALMSDKNNFYKNIKNANNQIIIMSKYFDKFEISKRVDSSNYMSYNAFW